MYLTSWFLERKSKFLQNRVTAPLLSESAGSAVATEATAPRRSEHAGSAVGSGATAPGRSERLI